MENSMKEPSKRQLTVELPTGKALRWTAKIVRLVWIPFVLAIGGRWLASALDVLTSSLLAFSVVLLGGGGENGLAVPEFLMRSIRLAKSPLTAALLLALLVTLAGRLIQTLVQWCLT